jgi:4-amino-4-deoxy-L-arabinose transferase-like glycosyltransferase
MKYYWKLIYWVWAGTAFCVIPIVWWLIYVFAKDVSIKDIFNDWEEHLESGNAWGMFDRGRNGRQPMDRKV